jgi:tetratricopeptide (TPR) repeat protein
VRTRRARLASAVIAGGLLAGCATAVDHGRAALARGDYLGAAAYFEAALAASPERLDALAGLGLARYKAGAWDEARDLLGRVVTRAPAHPDARLYLGLAALRLGDAGEAETHLGAFRRLRPDPRTNAQIERALGLLRGEPLTDEVREFVAASLETEAALVRERDEARARARAAAARGERWPLRCVPLRHGRLLCH